MNLSPLHRPELFWLGLALRLILVVFAVPLIAANWFAPFIAHFIASVPIDPWTSFLAAGGNPAAFPYGPVMLVFFVPGIVLDMIVRTILGGAGPPVIGYGLSLIAAELACLALLKHLKKGDLPLLCLWLSPAVIVISYWHGQNDLVPVIFVLASLVALRRYKAAWSGAALGLAIAAKLSMVLAIPVLMIYLYRNTRLRTLLLPFLAGVAGPVLLQLAIFALSPGARAMVLGTPEAQKVFQLTLNLGNGLNIYILPVTYLLLLFWAWRLRRMTFDLLLDVLGIVFLLVVLLTPASPGWFIWAAAFLALYGAESGPRGLILIFGLSTLQAVATLLQFTGASIPLVGIHATAPLTGVLGMNNPHAISILISTIFALGLFIALRMWREGVRRNELSRLSRRPLIIGIAGDSGSGKDTLATAIAVIFGERAVASIAGDDYHRWDRSRPMWNAMTHLDPRANDFERMTNDVLQLAAGRTVGARQYDHVTGHFTNRRLISFNDVIIVSGLHTLLIPALRSSYDVSIFLDMDEDLRRYFKIRRDVNERGHSLDRVLHEMKRRKADSERFITPQRMRADIVFSIQPANRDDIQEPTKNGDFTLKLAVILRKPAFYEALLRTLIGIYDMRVDVNFLEGSEAVEMVIDGDIDAEGIGQAAAMLIPSLGELIALTPVWKGGVTGLMQLIVLMHAARAIYSGEIST